MTIDSLNWLYSLEGRGSILGLERIKELLGKLGNPEKGLKCLHVAGTNGKGSVCAILASILKEAGYKTGMYTSPHLKRFNERFQINGEEIPDERISELIDKVRQLVTDQTFFEVATAMAFAYFAEEKVDFLVLEVGLGGRLDATNVVTPLVSVITNISLEHTKILGETEEKIAFEKAGIIKKGIPVVTLAKGKSLQIIEKMAEEKNARVFIPKQYKKINNRFDINSYKDLKLSLKGEFQMENASLALKCTDILREKSYDISEDSLKKGLENAYWPGRYEFIEKNILVDCAHNPAGVFALKKEIEKIRARYEKIISVVGILTDKDRKRMVEDITGFSDYIIFTKPKTKRASEPEKLAVFTTSRYEIKYDVKHALKKAKKLANPEDLIVVTGSIFTVGEVR